MTCFFFPARAAEAKAAEDEQRAALADVQAQEDARNNKTKELTAKGEDMNLGVVARNKAKNELAQARSSISEPTHPNQKKKKKKKEKKKKERNFSNISKNTGKTSKNKTKQKTC